MLLPDLVLRSTRVVTPSGTRPAAIHIRRGRILGVLDIDEYLPGAPVETVAGVIMPGVVDTHVHVDDFEATTRAAVAGGVTTIFEVPSAAQPVVTSVAALERRRSEAIDHSWTDVGFWGAITAENAREIDPMIEAGVAGFACALKPFPRHADGLSRDDLREALPILAGKSVTLLAHGMIPIPYSERRWFKRRKYADHLARFPDEGETQALAQLFEMLQGFNVRTHILHLSSWEMLTPLFRAQATRVPISAETCPHYLNLTADEIPDGSPEFVCMPPVRKRANREYLWAALANGLIRAVVSDHVTTADSDRCGVNSIRHSLAALWTGARSRGHSLGDVAEWMCRAPARLAGLSRKGTIEAGFDADLVVLDPDAEYEVGGDGDAPTPYRGQRLYGVVERTYVRGDLAYSRQDGWISKHGRTVPGGR